MIKGAKRAYMMVAAIRRRFVSIVTDAALSEFVLKTLNMITNTRGNTTLVTLVIESLQVMTTFHPNDYFEHVMTTLTQVMTIFVKFYVML